MNIENLIVDTIIKDEKFARKSCPYIKEDLFESPVNKKLFNVINLYYTKYQKQVNRTTLHAIMNGLPLEQDLHNDMGIRVDECFNNKDTVDNVWLLEQTNEWIRKRAVFNGVMKAIKKIEDKDNINDLPEIFKDALAQGFDDDVGLDLFSDATRIYEMMKQKSEKVTYLLDELNRLTDGGCDKKTLTVIIAGTNVGKTLAMCSLAADDLRQGRNVVYFTGEISEDKIGQRIYANLFDTEISALPTFTQEVFNRKATKLKETHGSNLIIKEYPTGTADTSVFRSFLRELFQKKGIVPDVIYVDYLNLFNSVRYGKKDANSYTQYKAVAEELRGIAVEFNVPLVTATQTNKEGSKSIDLSMTDTSESFGVPMTADLMIGLMEDNELRSRGLLRVKILKNRFAENNMESFCVEVNKPKMTIRNYNP